MSCYTLPATLQFGKRGEFLKVHENQKPNQSKPQSQKRPAKATCNCFEDKLLLGLRVSLNLEQSAKAQQQKRQIKKPRGKWLKKVRAKCGAERQEAEAEHSSGSECKPLLTQMMCAVNHGGNRSQDKNDWSLLRKIKSAIDSGAAETVIPHILLTEYAINQSERSTAGV